MPHFEFTKECLEAFETLKAKLISTLIVVAPDWTLPFELMCDARNYTLGAMLGQTRNKIFHVIYYASRTINDSRSNYATTEKEFLDAIVVIDKFHSYLLGMKVLIWTDYSAIRFLLAKKDTKPRLLRWILFL